MQPTLVRVLVSSCLSLPLLASAQNLITNGSFEDSLTGWTATNTPAGSANPITVIEYGTTASTYGEAIPADNAPGSGFGAGPGRYAVYFVKDSGTLTLTQSFTVSAAGTYTVGFSTYVPANGFTNPFDATFSAALDGGAVNLLSTAVSAQTPAAWKLQTQVVTLSAAAHTLTFTFNGFGVTGKDILVDRVYVTAIPEPGTAALSLVGLAALGLLARRRRVAEQPEANQAAG